ncbi:MAG: hypothetical protein DMF01_06455 [Verrucomicrobia bacterium]|nr:MAG: hypothetical protein DMF01_06455 [Verrucomicrobiota bacterium]
MAARKRNPTAQTLKARIGFRISKKPLVHVAADDERDNVGNSVGRSVEYGAPILFAIARDPRTIFTSWNIDWLSLFEKAVPVDRQVHLRLYGADGLQEKTVAVEPMAAMHYVTTSGSHASYRVEIGYYQPADVWHSVAISHEITMPPAGVSETTDVDLATIPFHVAFQQLLNLFRKQQRGALLTTPTAKSLQGAPARSQDSARAARVADSPIPAGVSAPNESPRQLNAFWHFGRRRIDAAVVLSVAEVEDQADYQPNQ